MFTKFHRVQNLSSKRDLAKISLKYVLIKDISISPFKTWSQIKWFLISIYFAWEW